VVVKRSAKQFYCMVLQQFTLNVYLRLSFVGAEKDDAYFLVYRHVSQLKTV